MRRGAALSVVAIALALGGCGRRGRLEPAPDPGNPFALGTPAPAADDASAGPDSKTKMGAHKRAKNPPIRAPNESFVLDPLL